MDTVKLSIQDRELTGNGPARRLRAEGRVPAVVYSKGAEAKAISLSTEEFVAAIHAHGHNVILQLEVGEGAKGKKKAAQYAVVKDFQRHPIKRNLLHVDLHEVHMGEEIEGQVSIELVGTPAGEGGVLDWILREVTVRALPSDMPDSVVLDVTGLAVGHHLTVEALKVPAGAKIVDDPQANVVTLVPPRVEQAAAGEVAEPDVVGGAKSEE
jgi:large subunit ribosomal protein L25